MKQYFNKIIVVYVRKNILKLIKISAYYVIKQIQHLIMINHKIYVFLNAKSLNSYNYQIKHAYNAIQVV